MGDSGWTNQVIQAFLIEIITGVPGSGLFVYNGTPALGNPPITSITGGTTDPAGNVVKPTIEVQGGGAIWVVGSAGQAIELTPGLFGSGNPAVAFLTGVSEEVKAANVQGIIVNPGAVNERPSVDFVSANVTGHADRAVVNLNSSAKDGSSQAFGSLQYQTTAAVIEQFLNWSVNGVTVFCSFAGDTIGYQAERLTEVLSADLVINTTGFTQQVFNGVGLGVGTYKIYGLIHASLSAAGQPQFTFTGGGGLVVTMLIDFWEINDAAPATLGNAGTVNALANVFSGATMGAGTRNTRFEGLVAVSTAGTFGMFAATSNVADPFTILHLDSFMEVFPVGG